MQRVCGQAAYELAAASLRIRFEKPDVLARRDLLVEADHGHLNVLPQARVHSTCVGNVIRGQHAPANAMLIVPAHATGQARNQQRSRLQGARTETCRP